MRDFDFVMSVLDEESDVSETREEVVIGPDDVAVVSAEEILGTDPAAPVADPAGEDAAADPVPEIQDEAPAEDDAPDELGEDPAAGEVPPEPTEAEVHDDKKASYLGGAAEHGAAKAARKIG